MTFEEIKRNLTTNCKKLLYEAKGGKNHCNSNIEYFICFSKYNEERDLIIGSEVEIVRDNATILCASRYWEAEQIEQIKKEKEGLAIFKLVGYVPT